ncbi:signal transduction histidine kinase [Saccharopolyspora erythraea NRRL 2338]|uniref:histidine kinase n=3 Tax=Saccharopolyspora erythraea TaxID=1836 RepID=A4FAE8_SACEN|nr:histidine kinase [Saccharopolyspora erythraea]PFG94810.1 signal transduction histidine kinase [Saccharopolyspora erythraea NRRL 2338]QRK91523.1 two-component sensor histidine kinase [Saccharopolyspora erythraea]CAM01023.1 two component system sensor kinase [Saccharopolyspora erythraea NRRL 2338]
MARTKRARRSGTGGLSRLNRLKPIAQAALLLAVPTAALISVGVPVNVTLYGIPLLVAFPLTVLHVASVELAVFRPWAAVVASVVGAFLLAVAGSDDVGAAWPYSVTALLTQILLVFVLALRADWPAGLCAWLGGVAVAAAAAALVPRTPAGVTANIAVLASVSGGLLVLGLVVQQWQAIRAQLLREREVSAEEHARRVLVEEKTRIARELHDVIAHSMSIINVQASTARYRYPGMDGELVGEFESMAASSRQALTEMRGLLGVLRDEEAAGELAPQPGLSRIPELVEGARRAGMRIDAHGVEVLGDQAVSDIAGVAAFRIVQEALSNATRHAPGTRAELRFGHADGQLTISVRNEAPARGSAAPASGGGHGLVGMRERAALLGGSVRTGPTGDGGFEVHAVLPMGTGDDSAKERRQR